MDADFARIHAPKDKAHLESSHRSLHHFEIQIIKAFEDRIVKTVPGYIFTRGKKEQITITLLDISRHELKSSSLIQDYCHEHNTTKHYFSENGKISTWVPEQKLGILHNQPKVVYTFRGTIAPSVRPVRLAIRS